MGQLSAEGGEIDRLRLAQSVLPGLRFILVNLAVGGTGREKGSRQRPRLGPRQRPLEALTLVLLLDSAQAITADVCWASKPPRLAGTPPCESGWKGRALQPRKAKGIQATLVPELCPACPAGGPTCVLAWRWGHDDEGQFRVFIEQRLKGPQAARPRPEVWAVILPPAPSASCGQVF